MTEVNARTRDFFDRQVIYLIKAKYGIEDMKAIRSFLFSEKKRLDIRNPSAFKNVFMLFLVFLQQVYLYPQMHFPIVLHDRYHINHKLDL